MANGGAGVVEARQAAADAASEVQREVLEQPRRETPKAPSTRGGSGPAGRGARPEWHHFEVTGWITNFNTIEFGFWRRERNKAKSRQFTNDMDIFAEVTEGGVRTDLLGFREDLWSKGQGFDKRLVFKLFSEGLNWRGTMDLMLARSIQQTIGAHGLPVSAFAINTNDHDQVVHLERSAHKWPLLPEDFSFFLLEDGHLQFYRIRQDFFRLGADYTVYDERCEVVARLDGRIFNIASKWKCRVRGDHKDKRLLTVLKLFCGMLIFHRSCLSHIRSLAARLHGGGGGRPKIERQEADLYLNPRRVR